MPRADVEKSSGRNARPLLAPGDTIGIVATGFAVRRSPLLAGARRLERMGYRVALGRHVFSREGYLAGDDLARAADLRAMLERRDVRALWFARGGYGTARILDRVPWRKLDGKLLVGYSDLTALFSRAIERSDRVCLYGPVVAELGDDASYDLPSLVSLLAGQAVTLRVTARQVLAPGKARGRLQGGNLTVLTHLWGTPFAPDLRGAVLFLEDVGEEAYRIDRMLTQLRLAGAFDRLAGVLLGHFSVPRTRRSFPPDRAVREILSESFVTLGVPVVAGLPAGHLPGKVTLPLGGRVEVDTAARTIRFTP